MVPGETSLMGSDPAGGLGLEQKYVDINGRLVSYMFRGGSPALVLIPGSHQDYRQYIAVGRCALLKM